MARECEGADENAVFLVIRKHEDRVLSSHRLPKLSHENYVLRKL